MLFKRFLYEEYDDEYCFCANSGCDVCNMRVLDE